MENIAVFRWLTVVCLAALAAEPALAAGPLLSQYTVFGENGVVIGVNSKVLGIQPGGALVGARTNNPQNGVAIFMNGNSLIDGDARSGAVVKLQTNAQIAGTLVLPAANLLTKAQTATIGGGVVAADPELPALPPATPIPGGCPTAGSSFGGPNNQSLALGPGTYGSLAFGGQFTLSLTAAGNYYFTSISAGNGATINVVPGAKVYVCDYARFGSAKVLPTTLKVNQFVLEVQGSDPANAFKAGGGSAWVGDVLAPNGGIHVGSGGSTSTVLGFLRARAVVDIEHGVTITATPSGDNGDPLPSKDATLLHSAKNENNGANNSLLVQYQVASVVGFDVHDVNLGQVSSAILRLRVCNTPGDAAFCPDPPSGWPAAGSGLDAFRLDQGFEDWGSGLPPASTPAEGDGNNIPIDDNPRGSGPGVTWNCKIDTEVGNERRDCTAADAWNGGLAFQGPARPSLQSLTNGMADGTAIDFDVTADVQAGLGSDRFFMTWFVRKLTGGGSVTFYSREGAKAKGDASLAPTLIIVP